MVVFIEWCRVRSVGFPVVIDGFEMTKRQQTVDMLSVALKLAQEEGNAFLAYLIAMALEAATEELQRR
jgi:hypothetical protein